MTKSTITRDELNEVIATYGKHHIAHRMANVLLAAMDSEPVAYISKSDFNAGYPHILARRDFNKACTMAVYAAQPAPVVPAVEIVAWRVWPEGSYSEGFIVDDTEDPAHKQGDTDALGRKLVSRPLSFSKVV